jgi:hypothetical protein
MPPRNTYNLAAATGTIAATLVEVTGRPAEYILAAHADGDLAGVMQIGLGGSTKAKCNRHFRKTPSPALS